MAELLLMPTGLPHRVCAWMVDACLHDTTIASHTDPHAVPPPTHYTGVTQTADTVSNLFAHKMFTKFRTVKRAFQLVHLLPPKRLAAAVQQPITSKLTLPWLTVRH